MIDPDHTNAGGQGYLMSPAHPCSRKDRVTARKKLPLELGPPDAVG
jgi:hypothetical protein